MSNIKAWNRNLIDYNIINVHFYKYRGDVTDLFSVLVNDRRLRWQLVTQQFSAVA